MHILVVNDDGPPSNQSSPYVHSLVKTLQDVGHVVSVVLPHQQRSWIGKAHFASQIVKPTYFRPGTLHQDDGTMHAKPLPSDSAQDSEEWILVDSTPASATQLGLFHFFQDRGPVDMVVSGPNYGRNTTSLFSLSSGTIGGAMEAAVCRKRAIALSYAFYSRDHNPQLIAGASRVSSRLIEHLFLNWDEGVDLYSINVPLVDGVENGKVIYTYALQNYWSSGSCFTEVEATEDEDPEKKEAEIRSQEGADGITTEGSHARHKHRHFKWTPNFADVAKSVEGSEPGNDGWAIQQGHISVTPLKANFMHLPHLQGELKLMLEPASHLYAHIAYEDNYTQPIILRALFRTLSKTAYTLISSLSSIADASAFFLDIASYESLSFDHLLSHPNTSLANSYIIRKALIRKHYLAHTVHSYLVKHPEDTALREHTPLTLDFEVDYAEFLDEALVEAYELHESFASNALISDPAQREWWILKPGMSDRGQGIRLFNSEEQLKNIFEEWDGDEETEEEAEEEADLALSSNDKTTSRSPSPTHPNNDRITTSHLRHFITQPYISPLLLPSPPYLNRKFHIRSYVLCVGALKVYIYKEMLALFAALPYQAPGSEESDGLNMRRHLTNTCLHSSSPTTNPSVFPLSSLPFPVPITHRDIMQQISQATSTLFLAATQQATTFQPLPNAFEIFGVDWLVDTQGKVWLLEVNAFPDFGMSGEGAGRGVVEGLWNGVMQLVLRRFFGQGLRVGEGMDCVLDVDLGRG